MQCRAGIPVARDDRIEWPAHRALITGGLIDLPADIETRCMFGDTPCAGAMSPAFANDGTIYLSLASSPTEPVIRDATAMGGMGGALVAFEPDGAIVDGWPIDLPERIHLLDLSVTPDDRLVARGYLCDDFSCEGDATRPTTFIFAPDGTLIEQRFED